ELLHGNVLAASGYLNAFAAANEDDEERQFSEQLRIYFATTETDLRSLSGTDSTALSKIDVRRGQNAAMARDMIHVAKSGHPYIYDHEIPRSNLASAKGSHGSIGLGHLMVYPNPTQGGFA